MLNKLGLKKWLLLFVIPVSTGCEKEQQGEINVHPKFEVYVDRFIEEAAQRGKRIDFSDTGLSIEFRDAVDTESGGVCRGSHRIEIEKFFWEDLNDAQKEGLIFHELGHCELDRRHLNDTLPNGEWKSRMRGSPIPEGLSAVINYNGVRRDYYVDELFEMNTQVPDWASFEAAYDDINSNEKVLLFAGDSTVTAFRRNFILPGSDNFEIEIEVNAHQSISFVGIQFGGSDHTNSFRFVFTHAGQLIIDSGFNLYGTMRDIKKSPAVQPGFNRITMRRVGDKFLVFLNMKFIYWFEVPEFFSRVVESFQSREGDPLFRNLRISRLL